MISYWIPVLISLLATRGFKKRMTRAIDGFDVILFAILIFTPSFNIITAFVLPILNIFFNLKNKNGSWDKAIDKILFIQEDDKTC